MNSDRGSYIEGKAKPLQERPDYMNLSNDQDEEQVLPNHVDTPLSNVQALEIESILQEQLQKSESASYSQAASTENQFKRKNRNRQNNISQYSMAEFQNCNLPNEQEQPLKNSGKPLPHHQYKNSCQISHNRNQSQLIDLTKKSIENISVYHQRPHSQMKILDDEQYNRDQLLENKENENPYRTFQRSTTKNLQANIALRIVDKELNQFCERVEKIKNKQFNPLTQREGSTSNRLSYCGDYLSQRKQSKSTPKKQQSRKLSAQEKSRSPSIEKLNDSGSVTTEGNQLIFKRKGKKVVEENQQTLNQEEKSGHKQMLIQLKKENQKLQRQMEQQMKDHENEIKTLKEQLNQQQRQKIKEVEDENLIIIEGLKQEYEERIVELKNEIASITKKLREENDLACLELERKLEKKQNKYVREKADLKLQIEEYKFQIESLQKQFNELNQITSQQENLFKTNESEEESKYQSGDFLQRHNQSKGKQLPYLSQRSSKNNLFKLNESDDENTPYQCMENFISLRQKSFFNNNDISNIVHHHGTHRDNYYSLSQHQEDSAMNFSFSDVKTSVDKSAQFERNMMMILYTENHNNMLEKVPQEEDEDDEQLTNKISYNHRKNRQSIEEDEENIKCENSDDEYETSQYLPSERCGEKRNIILYSQVDMEGSENAPEDSGFVSDDLDYQERIVNESSLEEGDDMLIMTGRSESAIDEEDEISGISKCKAINSSYINLKRNNLLISYGNR